MGPGLFLPFSRLTSARVRAVTVDICLVILYVRICSEFRGGDGLAGQVITYIYDAAGNRRNTGITVDNLNRATASQDGARSSDILGNTTMITFPGNAQRNFDWDCLNRLTAKRNGSTIQASYAYRADGMRVYKNTNNISTAYLYDGQMGMEDVETSASSTTVTDYGLGARGIDWISKKVGTGTPTVVFPIYDAHGNMMGDIQRGTGGTYTVNDERTYDAWGSIRAGAQQNDPKGRYCASLGHKADDETGFIYMRARYYEPSTARWLSEDSSKQDGNWFAYAGNIPTDFSDSSGYYKIKNNWTGIVSTIAGALCVTLFSLGVALAYFGSLTSAAELIEASASAAALCVAGLTDINDYFKYSLSVARFLISSKVFKGVSTLLAAMIGKAATAGGIAAGVTIAAAAYSVLIMGYLICNFQGLDNQ